MIDRKRGCGARGSRAIRVLRAMVVVTAVMLLGWSDRVGGHVADGHGSPTSATDRTHGFVRTDAGAFVGLHPGARFSSTIDETGARLAGLDATWTMGLHVARIGRAGAMRKVGRSAPTGTNERVEIARRGGVTEWFAHRDRGLEHGIDVSAPPAGAGDLLIEVAVEGWTAVAAGDGQRVDLRDAGTAMTLTYGELSVKDANGRDVAARMDVSSGTVTIAVRDAAARYPLVVDPLVWVQQTRLVADGGEKGDQFGYSVALGNEMAIVGAWKRGAAYAFVRSGSTWSQQATLVAKDPEPDDKFGSSVALSGSTAIVGAYDKRIGSNLGQGAAYVFVQSGGTAWTQGARLVAKEGGAAADNFGSSVALSGSTAIVGADWKKISSNEKQGAAYIFVKGDTGGTTWTQQAMLVAPGGAPGDEFGTSVALDNSTAIVGAFQQKVGSNVAQGAAYVFVQSGSTWSQQARLVAEDGAGNDKFGSSVALRGSTAIVGAYWKEVGTHRLQGAAYVFAHSGTTWTQKAKLVAADGAERDFFGVSVALDGSTAIVGAQSDPPSKQGAAYVFVQSDGAWAQQAKIVAPDSATDDFFGWSVALSGSTAIVGAYDKKVGDNRSQGAAYVFVPAKSNTCTVGTECASGFCVSGVCCDRACNGQCEACAAAKKVSGVDGTCGAAADPACGPPTATPAATADKSKGCGCVLPGATEHGERRWVVVGLGMLAILIRRRSRGRRARRSIMRRPLRRVLDAPAAIG